MSEFKAVGYRRMLCGEKAEALLNLSIPAAQNENFRRYSWQGRMQVDRSRSLGVAVYLSTL